VTLPSCFACDAEQGTLCFVLLPMQSPWSAPKCALGTGTSLKCASHGKGWKGEFMSSCQTGTVFLRMVCIAFLQNGGGRSCSTACEWRGCRERLLHHGRRAPWAGRAVRQSVALTQVPSTGTWAESSPLHGKLKTELTAGPCCAFFLQLSVQRGQHNETSL